MKKTRTALALLAALCLLLAAAGGGAETYVDRFVNADGQIPDTETYAGNWQDVYLQVLEKHSDRIHSYQAIPFEWDGEDSRLLPCFPVGLRDLNGDGISELYFLEAEGDRGDLYIYSGNGSAGQCVLYVPGITRPDYDATLGFEVYLLRGGILGIRHYSYEDEYLLEFSVNREGPYILTGYMYSKPDGSGEGDGLYCRNGTEISHDAYYDVLEAWNAGGECISEYFAKDEMSYGFDYTWETAVSVLDGTAEPVPQQAAEVYGLAVEKLATRKGPGTQYVGGGTYSVKGQQIKLLARAWDGSIWWIKCEIPYRGEIRVLWTGYRRFDHDSFNLEELPEETW